MSITYRYRKQIAIVLFLILTFSTGGFSIYQLNKKKKVPSQKNKVLLSSKKTTSVKKVSKEENTKSDYKVDIKGEIINPGLYSLKEGSRVSDVIALAGGLTENGDTSVINLSKKITDEMVIIIYSREQVSNFSKTKEKEQQIITNCQNSYEGITNNACINNEQLDSTDHNLSNLVSINEASLEELQTLAGIGSEKAKNIISYREEHGKFQNIEELKNVTGIGESIFAKIKDYITL